MRPYTRHPACNMAGYFLTIFYIRIILNYFFFFAVSGRREGAGERASKQMECFFFGVGPPENRNMVRQFDARQYDALTLYAVRGYVALTQDTDLRHYVTLTSGSRARG